MSRCKSNWHDYLWLGMWSLRTRFFVADLDDAQRRAAGLRGSTSSQGMALPISAQIALVNPISSESHCLTHLAI